MRSLCAAAQATQRMLARDAARSLSSTLPEIDVCVPQIAERIEQCFSLLTFSFFSSTRTGRCPPSNLSGAPRRRMPAVRPSMRKPRGREAVLMPALCADIRSSAGSPVGGQTKCEGGQQTRLRRSAGMLACSMISTPHRHSRGRHQCHARSTGSRPGAFLQLDRRNTV